MVSTVAQQLLNSASARFDQVTADLMELWEWPCSCDHPGGMVGCMACPGFRLFVEDMQEQLSQGHSTSKFVQLPPLTLEPPYSVESRQNCLLLYRRGFSLTKIQRVTGVANRKIIRRWLIEENLLSLSIEDHQTQRRKCLDLYKKGYKLYEIEDETRVPGDLVSCWAKQDGIKRTHPQYTEAQRQECFRLYFDERLPRFQVSKRTGVSDHQVKQWLEDPNAPRQQNFKRGTPLLYSDHDKKMCNALFQKGYTPRQVEEITGIGIGTLLSWLKEYCLKLLEEGYSREHVEKLSGVGYRVLKRWWCDTINSSA
jgi:hypothetical protein